MMRSYPQAADTDTLIGGIGDDLLDAKESVIDPIQSFLNGAQRMIYDEAAALLDRALADGFIGEEVRASVVTAPTAAEVLDAFASWQRPALGKWTERPVTL